MRDKPFVDNASQVARITWPTWGPPGSCRSQVGPMLGPWTLLSGSFAIWTLEQSCQWYPVLLMPFALCINMWKIWDVSSFLPRVNNKKVVYIFSVVYVRNTPRTTIICVVLMTSLFHQSCQLMNVSAHWLLQSFIACLLISFSFASTIKNYQILWTNIQISRFILL